MVGPGLPQLDLQPGPLLGRIIQTPPGVGQLGLIQGFESGHLPAPDLLLLVDLQVEDAVLGLQAPDLVDVGGQAVVELPELLLLLQSGDPGRAQGSPAAATCASLAGRSRSRGRHCCK